MVHLSELPRKEKKRKRRERFRWRKKLDDDERERVEFMKEGSLQLRNGTYSLSLRLSPSALSPLSPSPSLSPSLSISLPLSLSIGCPLRPFHLSCYPGPSNAPENAAEMRSDHYCSSCLNLPEATTQNTQSRGEVLRGESSPLCHRVPFGKCLSPSHLSP